MTTSGSTTFNMNAYQVAKSALRKIGAISAGETPDNQTVQDVIEQMNMIMKSLAATGLHVWTETEATLFLQPNRVSYTLGGDTTDHCTETYTSTTLAASALSGATTIEVTSASDFGAGYSVGVVVDDGTISWAAQVGAAAGTTITIDTGLTDAATNGAAIYVYQTDIVRPLRVVSGRRYAFSNSAATGISTQMSAFSRIDYRNQPNKDTTGTITQYFYDPKGGANTQGVMYVWPAPPDVSNAMKFTWWRPLQDFDTVADTPDLPQEWLDCLVWNTAFKMAPEYDCPPQRYAMIKEQAASSLDLVMGFDREPESYFFGFNADQTVPA